PTELKMEQQSYSIITIANQKGGVGKTTGVVNIASAYATMGNKVLVIDLDYQANTSSLLRVKEEAAQTNKNVTFAIKNKIENLEDVVIQTEFENIDCLAATKQLNQIPEQYLGRPNQFQLLHPILRSKDIKKYDLILID